VLGAGDAGKRRAWHRPDGEIQAARWGGTISRAGSFSRPPGRRPALQGRFDGQWVWRRLWAVITLGAQAQLGSPRRKGPALDQDPCWDIVFVQVRSEAEQAWIRPPRQVGGRRPVRATRELPIRRRWCCADRGQPGQARTRSGRGQRATGGARWISSSCCSDPPQGRLERAISRSRSEITALLRQGRHGLPITQIEQSRPWSAGSWSLAQCSSDRPALRSMPWSPATTSTRHAASASFRLQAGRPAFCQLTGVAMAIQSCFSLWSLKMAIPPVVAAGQTGPGSG